jgi:hypothetical protein
MSGLLERMAKRALGRLPTMQPLIPSIYAPYAPPPANLDTPAAPGFLPSSVELETGETAAPRRAPAEATPNAGQHPEPFEKPAGPDTPPPARQPPRKVRPQPPLAQPTALVSHREAAAAAAPSPVPGVNPEPFQRLTAQLRSISHAVPTRQNDAARLVQEPTPAAALPREPSQPERIGQLRTPPLQRRRLQAQRAESAAPSEQKPEIHISIGSIELRAAPAEPRPAPAPFRPRVSLQDFLNRKTGATR